MEWRLGRIPISTGGLDSAGEVLALLVTLLALAFFLHLAAKVVIDRSTIAEALVVAVLGVLLGVLVYRLITVHVIGRLVAVVVFAVVTGLVYRVKPLKGAAVGALAWVLWTVVADVADWLLGKAS